MNGTISHIVAKTHTAEYGIHKYWSRKPHNVLREILQQILGDKERPTVVDPFCGSGVALSEAARLGADVFGADLNPVAALLSTVTCSPPEPVALEQALDELIGQFETTFGQAYRLSSGEDIRYVVHALVATCGCGAVLTQEETRRSGRQYLCPACGKRVSFNLRHNVRTRVLQIRTGSAQVLKSSSDGISRAECERQQQLGLLRRPEIPVDPYDRPMVANGRVLVFPGMLVSDLFTPRAFCAAAWLFNAVEKIEDDQIRQASLLFLTSTVAQFSRLIPYRNDLTTGGPAWTVPGFWVAPIHLETNPVVHLRARKERFVRGMSRLWQHRKPEAKSSIACKDAAEFLDSLPERGIRPDLIFLDPPYGDSVPYLEFSAIWNAMLKARADYEHEIVISDRTEYPSGRERYAERLATAICKSASVLAPSGHILVTFNNLDYAAWHALLQPIRKAGLRCLKVHYQVPAVVSAKAQFSPENSYQGDFYCVFGKDAVSQSNDESGYVIKLAVVRALRSRGGTAPGALVQRAAIMAILRDNLNPDYLLKLDSFIATFARREGQRYALLRPNKNDFECPTIGELICSTATEQLRRHGVLEWDELYKYILDATEGFGVASEREAREALVGILEFGPRCRLKVKSEQGALFPQQIK